MALVHLLTTPVRLVHLFMMLHTHANSLLDVYTTTGVTTYEVTATAEVDVPTFNPGGYTGATGPNRTKGCKSKFIG